MRSPLVTAALLVAVPLGASATSASNPSSLPSLAPRESNASSNASATFFYAADPDSPAANFTFTLTAVAETGDLYYRLAVAEPFSWVAVGTGASMTGALMLVHYANTNGRDVVLSPRLATGHTEPSYSDQIQLEPVSPPPGDAHPNGIRNGTLFAAARCANCSAVGHGVAPLDLSSKAQPFIFALGSAAYGADSNAADAPLARHAAYGFFTLDMTRAALAAGSDAPLLPPLGAAMDGAALDGDVRADDDDRATSSHGLMMCFAFLILFPLGVFVLRILGRVRLHAYLQAFGFAIVVVAAGVGLFASKYYNRTKHISSAHQILGLVVVVLLAAQLAVGAAHHRHFAKTQQRLRGGAFIRAHRLAGPLAMAAGFVNGALGFRLSLARWNVLYAPLVGVVALCLVLAFVAKIVRVRKGAARQRQQQQQQQQQQQWGMPPQPQPPQYPAGPPPPYAGAAAAPPPHPPQQQPPPPGPYNDGGWAAQNSRGGDDIQLQDMETAVRPKQYL